MDVAGFTSDLFNDGADHALGGYCFNQRGLNHEFAPFPGGLSVVVSPDDLEIRAEAAFAYLDFRVTVRFLSSGDTRCCTAAMIKRFIPSIS